MERTRNVGTAVRRGVMAQPWRVHGQRALPQMTRVGGQRDGPPRLQV
jgi:hypothetical protein